MKVALCTLGCKVNQYDTDAMRELFENAGHETVDFDSVADVYVVNTCTVTQTGDKKSRQMVSRAHALAPEAKVIVTGCFAQRAPEEALSLPGVSLVLGTSDRGKIVELAQGLVSGDKISAVAPHGPRDRFESLTVSREGRTRAYLKIEDGCDRYCAYCIIPYARGPVRSRPLEDVRRQLALLNAQGYREVVLTGIHLMSYGKDLDGVTLADALAQAEGLERIARIRLGSLEPRLVSDELLAALTRSGKVCRQFHLSLQSGSASVLARMNRRYTPQEYAACVARLRQAMPGCAITTDVIVGFPGETEEEFRETLAFAKSMGLARIHVFPYSRRKGTKAYDFPDQIPQRVKRERAGEMIALAKELERGFAQSLVNTRQQILFEELENGLLIGHTDTYVKAYVSGGGEECLNRIHTVNVLRAARDGIEAVMN